MNILLLEDDFLLSEIIEEHLLAQNHTVITASSGEEADTAFSRQPFDLLLLDVNVPGMNGMQLLKMLREEGYEGTAIFITSLHGTENLKKGFDSGADDYIRKPFGLDELDVRIANVLRLKKQDSRMPFSENVALDTDACQLTIDSDTYDLRNKECRILACLIRKKGKIVSQEELLSAVWGYDERPDDSTLRSYIKNLRKLLGADSIKTIRNAGYRLDTV